MTQDPRARADQPVVAPVVAAGWLRAWQAIGGGVTIAKDGTVHPWRMVDEGAPDPHARRAKTLLEEMEITPSLNKAVRSVMRAEARKLARRKLK